MSATLGRGRLLILCRPRQRLYGRQWLSTSSSSSSVGEQLRVAVVGGGTAGLSTALHLAPLVEAGLVASPVDVYDAPPPQTLTSTDRSSSSSSRSSGSTGRNIGVGIWSTALDPFLGTGRQSHHMVYQEMTAAGRWVGDVGYRTPSGHWLMTSHLPTNEQEAAEMGMPALLFLREKDMMRSLQKAVHLEELRGMIRMHRDGRKTRVTGLYQQSSRPWSTQLVLNDGDLLSERDYHLIIAADGTHSIIRRDYGGRDLFRRIRLTGTSALPSPIELPPSSSTPSTQQAASWDEARRQEEVGLQDRKYTVFRGNANMPKEDGVAFQTWGVGRSMRFATVPMLYPGPNNGNHKREERQVWFITIDDDDISSEPDSSKRRQMLLETFRDWHDPICRTVEATPPEEILMERAIAHRHCTGPVLAFNKVVRQMNGVRPPNSGEGPCVVFVGDAYMTVDPILAQGFTVAMEGAYALRRSVEQSCIPYAQDSSLAFDPYLLRKSLRRRHEARMDRLVCLLRVTELVQALGQPTGGLGGLFNTKLLRPLLRLIPNVIKAPVFNSVLKYSLGLSPFASASAGKSDDDGPSSVSEGRARAKTTVR